ncbi:hypothetical protein A4H34_03320 [Peptidiphaga gingivicola]|uniref:CRISPR-associated endonuclease Cas1 n=1 Tax=Peptidiphaga gingivicola TaxID=2741497 RepID=A0A179B4Q3_9ACTO|nr:CRISPR-associated endonuclease Cas1 [Peptidiphaga gingivicola]OAP86213.1 hypothetical protein A4H34_03320 [Peptidiphaga gingivicola]
MDASLHSQARGSFRRRPILAGSGCFGKDRYPLRILEIARTSERAEKPPELRLGAPGLDGEARPPTLAGSAFRGAAGFGSVFERLTSFEELAAAWNAVLAEDILDQQLRRQAKEIGADLAIFLDRLSAELRTGLYKPGPLYPLKRERLGPLRGGLGAPVLWVPSLRDGIVERAVAAAVGPAAEALQSSSSFGARTGLGIDAVVGRLTRLRGEGCANVLLLEIEGCASGVDLDDALETLRRGVPCERTLDLLCLLGLPRFEGVRPGAEDRLRGVLEGSSLRPLLENLALTDVDDAMCDAGFAYLRHGSKIAMCAPGRSELVDGLALISELVRSRGLTINEDATAMTSFDEGFCHLGIDYSQDRPLEPSAEAAAPVHVVYVGRDGSRVHVAKERLIVDTPDGLPQMSIPRRMVSRIVLTGNVGLSAGARSWALYNDIDVLCLSRRGTYLGQLAGPRSTANAQRLLRQAEFAADEEARLPLARSIVRAKLRNQLHVLHRLARREREGSAGDVESAGAAMGDGMEVCGNAGVASGGGASAAAAVGGACVASEAAGVVGLEAACRDIRCIMADLPDAASIEEIMGMEGAASNVYFACVAGLLPPEVSFPCRSRRPPRDMANAALSYAYSLLLGECTAALFAAGLEPSLGVLHASTDKRPSLSLDLMEEFRPLLVDRMVFGLLRSRRLRPEHAGPSDDGAGVWLTKDGKKAVVDGYEATLQRSVKGALPGFAGPWRRHIHHSAQLLGRAILEPGYDWVGVSWR